jgi:putative cell wall-binding protein/Tol biopolymer transport system component
MVSVSDAMPPQSGNENSREPSVSSDGRYIVFTSSATNIGSITTTARLDQVYLRDMVDGTTRVVSSLGGVLGNGDSDRAVISGDGMFVAFISTATNLMTSARSANAQVLLWSRASGTFTHVSMSNDAVPNAANGRATGVAISGDGREVVFSSNATNLVSQLTFGMFQVYVRDVVAGTTSLVSIDSVSPGSGSSLDVGYPSISDDGRVVAFVTAGALTSVDPQSKSQVYVRDLSSSTTEMVSVSQSGGFAGTADSFSPSLSADGHAVAFASEASNLSMFGSGGRPQIFVRDRSVSSTAVVSVDPAGRSVANGGSFGPAISDDGSVVAFGSSATNLIPETGGQKPDLTGRAYIRTLSTQRTATVCRSSVTPGMCNDWSASPALSGDGSVVAFASAATDLTPEIAVRNWQVYVRDTTEVPWLERVGGVDRFGVSAGVASDAFGSGVPVAYVASGAGFADALSGSAAAGAERGPMLLVTKDAIPTVVGIALHRLKPQRIVVLGGTNSVDASVEAALAAYAPTVSRISGADRFEVSAEVSKAVFGRPGTVGGEHPPVYVASGAVFPDALSGSAAVGTVGGPVLLVAKDGVPASVLAELKRLAPSTIVVLGGRNTIADSVVTTLGAMAPTSRVDGADRFAVSAAVSASSFPGKAHTVYVASGAVFPDALSGSAAAIQNRGPVLLVTANTIPAAVATELDRLDPTRIVVLGGPNTVSEAVFTSLENYLKPA